MAALISSARIRLLSLLSAHAPCRVVVRWNQKAADHPGTGRRRRKNRGRKYLWTGRQRTIPS